MALCIVLERRRPPRSPGQARRIVACRHKVLLPGVSVLERFVGRIRDRAQKRLWKRLVAALDAKQRERIAKLELDSDFYQLYEIKDESGKLRAAWHHTAGGRGVVVRAAPWRAAAGGSGSVGSTAAT